MQVRTGGADRDGPSPSGRRVVASDRGGDGVFADDGQDPDRPLERRQRRRARGLQLPASAPAGAAVVPARAQRAGRAADPSGEGQDELGSDAPDDPLRATTPSATAAATPSATRLSSWAPGTS